MLSAVVVVSLCSVALAAPQIPVGSVQNANINNVPNMFKALDVQSMVKHFDPKFVVINDQQGGEVPVGVQQALVKSLISDLHNAEVPVVYAQKRSMPML